MGTCFFCDRLAGTRPVVGGAIYEDDLVHASHWGDGEEAVYLGYLVVQTKRHALVDRLTDAEARAVGLAMGRLGRALTRCVGAERVYATMYAETTPHLHLFLAARYPGAPEEYWRGRALEWPGAPRGGPEAIAALAERLRQAVREGDAGA
jgi:hypothetical protein